MKKSLMIFTLGLAILLVLVFCSVKTGPEMVLVEGGTFMPHVDYVVTLSSYYIGKYPVTQAEYQDIMGSNPSHFTGDMKRPVEMVSWFDAIEFCNRLSIAEGLQPVYSYGEYGTDPDNWPVEWNSANENHNLVFWDRSAEGYRLPTDMEWRLAARGGIPAQDAGSFEDKWAGTNDEEVLGDYIWYEANSGGRQNGTTHPVGMKLPNELGLYDMGGNVMNWCWDNFEGTVFPEGFYQDPTGPERGEGRVSIGGSSFMYAEACSIDSWHITEATVKWSDLGFRIAR